MSVAQTTHYRMFYEKVLAVADWPIGIWAMPGGLLIRSGHWPAPTQYSCSPWPTPMPGLVWRPSPPLGVRWKCN